MVRPDAKAALLLFDPARVRARSVSIRSSLRRGSPWWVNGWPAYAEGRKLGAPGTLQRAR
jgi:hypothetical protein